MIRPCDLPKIVVPITEQTTGPLPLLGSGCFFRRGDRIFLVTATHVIEGMPSSPKSVMVPRTPAAESELWHIGGGHMTSVAHDKGDVAVFRLDNPSMISDVLNGGWRVLTDDDVETGPVGAAMVCGWPHARLRPVDGGLRATLLAFNVQAIEAPEGAKKIFPNDVFLSWPVGTDEPVPNLGGISGSPLWSRRGEEIRLLGVQHSVLQDRYIRGTHWSLADFIVTRRT